MNKIRIVTLSDTHTFHRKIKLPPGDLLIFAGDLSHIGRQSEVEDFISWLIEQSVNYQNIIFIAGNHDKCFDPKFGEWKVYSDREEYDVPTWLIEILNTLPDNVHYLENSWIELYGLMIWGSPVTPWYHGDNWVFNAHRGEEIKKIWDEIPILTDIVITHGPMSYKLDYVPRDAYYAGCHDLRYALETIKPALHISGHIHEGYGIDFNDSTTFINASMVDNSYRASRKPWVVDLDLTTKEVTFIDV